MMKTFLLFWLGVACLGAEMVFERLVHEILVDPEEESVIGVFPFEVQGAAVTIVDYEARCTCLEVRIDPTNPDRSTKLTWGVGEKGVVRARFDTTKFLGTVEKSVHLNVQGKKEPIVLTVRITVPELVKLEPTTLRWDLGAEATTQVIKITMTHENPIKIVSHASNNEGAFPYALKTIREGWEYELSVKPTSTAEAGISFISLRTDSTIGRFKRATAYAVTRPKLNEKPVAGE